MWLIYDRATPGSTSRRLRRLQKLKDATAAAIQKEVSAEDGDKGRAACNRGDYKATEAVFPSTSRSSEF